MIDPPIDKLIKKAPCRYALVCGLAKRAKELIALESGELENLALRQSATPKRFMTER